MPTLRTPTREPAGLSSNLTPSPSQYTFSSQRAEFTKPVPAGLLPVYPNFAGDSNSSDSDDGASIVNMLTEAMATHQGQNTSPSAAEGNGQLFQDVGTMATAEQSSPVRGFAEKSGISPTLNSKNSPQKVDWPSSKINDMKANSDGHSNSLVARLVGFLGLQKRQEQQLDRSFSSVIPPLTGVPLPAVPPTKKPKYLSPLRSDPLRTDSGLLANASLDVADHRNTNMHVVIEDDCEPPYDSPIGNEQPRLPGQANELLMHRNQGQPPSYTSASYPPLVLPKPSLRYHRSRSLDITRLPVSNQAPLIAFAQEVPPSDSRSRSMDDRSRRGQSTFMDWPSSRQVPAMSLPPNCVLVQVWAVGLDESDRQLVVGSDGCKFDGAYNSKEHGGQVRKQCKDRREEEAVNYSIFKGPKLFGWSLDFGAKKKQKELVLGRVTISKPLSTQATQKYNGAQMVREVSRPKSVPQGLGAGYIPGQSFVGRVCAVGSVVDRDFATKDDWVIGLVDVGKCGPLDEFIVINWQQIHRVSAPYEPCPFGRTNSISSTLVSESPSGKPTEDVARTPGTEEDLLPHNTPLSLEELALLPLCGIPAYRAVVTCIDEFPMEYDNKLTSECPDFSQRRRALVLRGHDGVGAMAVQMLIQQGWGVSVHVPFSRVPWDATQAEADGFMLAIENRLKKWGVNEVVYDDANSHAGDGEIDDRKAAVVRVIETLRADGDVFHAILDFVGGKEIREASERLLRLNGCSESHGVGLFTSFFGDVVDDEHITQTRGIGRKVKYTWMNSVFESEDQGVWEVLGSVLRLVLDDGIRPHVEEAGGEIFGRRRVVSPSKASDVLVDGDLLSDGGMVVVRVVRQTPNLKTDLLVE